MIDKDNPIPIYIQIKDDIFTDIETGKYLSGERLPAERILAEKYDVTRITISKALKLLADQGYIEVRRGSGSVVMDRKHAVVGSKNNMIGVLVPDIQRGIMVDLIRGIEDAAIAAGYNTILCNTDNQWGKANIYIDQLIGNGVKGVIYYPIQEIENGVKIESRNEEVVQKLIDNNKTIILVDHECKNVTTDLVVTDNFGGGFEMTNHLLGMGHHRIVIVYDFKETSIEDRIAGYKEALKRHDVEFDPNLIQHIKEYGFTESFSELIKVIKNELKATAVFAMNDLLAADIYFHSHNLEISIPKDLSVVGYDDLQFADKMRTPLTTIHQPLYEMGREGFKLFLERLQKPDVRYRKVILPNRLIIRKSVKKLN